ncbi:hypothetical protein DY000_02062247 [Brassica cretica]|uniref:Ribosomal protein eL8/eL30/eS12/Gadd45 domain-containing protein n=1 Tax=Brassica cretica TaxID=69181 RepID=A0ABQ7B1W1_BRACR|nr:hypothetical protein DY000_02062247 [Brassica cretica]
MVKYCVVREAKQVISLVKAMKSFYFPDMSLRRLPYNVDLGTACGKYFRVSCLSIVDPGDSDIIKSIPGDQ